MVTCAPMVIQVGRPGGSFSVSCQGYFSETHGTIFHGKHASPELIVRVLACLAEGLGIRGTARVFELDPNTILRWLVEAAEQLKAFSASCYVNLQEKKKTLLLSGTLHRPMYF